MKQIGKVSQIISMTNYLCSVFREGEIENVPTNQDYKFGTLVKIEVKGGSIVGIITDITTVTPGERIPLKVPDVGQAQRLYPAFYSGMQTFVVVTFLGLIQANPNGSPKIIQGFPGIIPEITNNVWSMDDSEILGFHKPDGKLTFGYYSRFSKEPNFEYAFCTLCEQIIKLSPGEAALVRKLKQNVEFLSKVKAFSKGGS
jgi:hypothetical protein